MSDKDFKVKNKLQVKGITSAGPVVSDASGNLDSTAYIATQYGGTGTSTSPNSGQILYSASGTTYAPTTLSGLDVKGATYSTSAPSSPFVGQVWVQSDSSSDSFDPNIMRRKSFTATASQTVFTTDYTFIDGYEQVYFNGMLLLRNTDYTTTGSSSTVTLSSGAAAGDILEVVTITNLNSVNTYTQAEISSTYAPLSNPTFTAIGGSEGGQINFAAAPTNTTLSGNINLDVYQNKVRLFEGGGNNRGAYIDLTTLSNSVGSELIAATPQSGNSGKYLTTDGTSASWSAVNGMTLLSTTTLSTTTTTVSSISSSYKHLFFLIRNFHANGSTLAFRTNGITTSNYYANTQTIGNGFAFSAAWSNGATEAQFNGNVSASNNNNCFGWIYDYSNAAVAFKPSFFTLYSDGNDKWAEVRWVNRGIGTNPINSITVFSPGGGTINGTLLIYGVN